MTFQKRKFAYKHPTFGRSKAVKSGHPYKNSAYYLWWEFLKRNNDYKNCCLKNGKGKLSSLYADFGNIFDTDFKTWWQQDNKGTYLFAEEVPLECKLISEISDHSNNDVLFLQIPLALPKRFLTQKFSKILKIHHKGRAGIRTNLQSTAKYPIKGHIDISALQKCLEVYDMKINEDLSYWEIAQKCKVARPIQFIKDGDTKYEITNKKRVLTSTAERLFRRAEKIINGTSLGKFPLMK
jgi:hypothetical protein